MKTKYYYIILGIICLISAVCISLYAQEKNNIFYEVNGSLSLRIERNFYNYQTQKYEYDSNDFECNLGNKFSLQVYVFDENLEYIPEDNITWSSSDENIVTIDQEGYIEAVAIGEATITAKLPNGVSDTIKVTVRNIGIGRIVYVNAEIDYSDFNLTFEDPKGTLNLYDKDTGEILSYNVNWSSSDESVVRVDSDVDSDWYSSYYYPTGFGEAVITAEYNGLTASINVTVPKRNIGIGRIINKKIDYSNFSIKMYYGDNLQLFDKDTGEELNRNVNWSSSDESVVFIYKDGNFCYPNGLGEAVITAEYHGLTASINVTVDWAKEIIIKGVFANSETHELEYSPNDCEMNFGESSDLHVYDENGQVIYVNEYITWSSSDENVIAVYSDGKIEAIGIGEAIITATLPNGVSDTIKITVNYPKEVTIKNYAYNSETHEWEYGPNDCEMNLGESSFLDLYDENGQEISYGAWSSSDENVVSVNKKGQIVTVGIGEAIITATLPNGVSDTIKITVNYPKEIIIYGYYFNSETQKYKYDSNDFELTITIIEEARLYAFDTLGSADMFYVTWTSSDENIIAVDSDGKIEAVGFGTATITATLPNGVSDTINITVPCYIDKFNIGRYVFSDNKTNINFSDFTLNYGKTDSLYMFDTEKREIPANSWTSSDENIVLIDEYGNAEAVGFGTSTVTATLPNGVSDTIKINVPKISAIKIGRELYYPNTDEYNIDFSNFELNIDNYEFLCVYGENEEYINPSSVKWKSSDENILSVDEEGFVYASGIGTASVKATFNGVSDTIKIKVTGDIPAESISLDKDSITLKTGKTATLKATVLPENTADKTVTWTSSNENVVQVKSGKIKGISAGIATVVASTNNGKKAFCNVTVTDNIIHPTEILLNKNSLTLGKGKSETLTATVNPKNAADKSVTWYSSDETIATVSENGTVKGLKEGNVYISAFTNDGGLFDICEVTVADNISVTGVELDKTEITVNIGDIVPLTATVLPTNATNKDVEWKSSDTSIVKVNAKGEFKAYKAGKATVSVRTIDGKKVASCKITVAKDIPVTGVRLDKTEITVNIGDIVPLTATVLPANATNKDVEWKSSDTSIVKVNAKGEFKAYKAGKATVSVRTIDGKKVASCKITVAKDIPVTGVKLDKTEITVTVEDIVPLTATVLPANATNKDVEWKSSDTNIVKVNAKGEFKAYKTGKATVSVRTKDGKFVASCKVTVKDSTVPVTGVELDKTSITVNVGDITALTATVKPSNATNKDVEWKSDNTNVVKVNAKGEFKAYKAGKATVSVRTKDGKFVASCKVTVK